MEAYVLDRDDLDLYGESVMVEFTAAAPTSAETLKFETVDALKQAMAEDVATCRRLLVAATRPGRARRWAAGTTSGSTWPPRERRSSAALLVWSATAGTDGAAYLVRHLLTAAVGARPRPGHQPVGRGEDPRRGPVGVCRVRRRARRGPHPARRHRQRVAVLDPAAGRVHDPAGRDRQGRAVPRRSPRSSPGAGTRYRAPGAVRSFSRGCSWPSRPGSCCSSRTSARPLSSSCSASSSSPSREPPGPGCSARCALAATAVVARADHVAAQRLPAGPAHGLRRPERGPAGAGVPDPAGAPGDRVRGLVGAGVHGRGAQTQGGLIPYQLTDFIFSVAGEELGFVGSVGLLLLLGFGRGPGAAGRRACCEDTFGRLVAVGVATWLAVQVFENVGMNLGLLPVTGLPAALHLLRGVLDAGLRGRRSASSTRPRRAARRAGRRSPACPPCDKIPATPPRTRTTSL